MRLKCNVEGLTTHAQHGVVVILLHGPLDSGELHALQVVGFFAPLPKPLQLNTKSDLGVERMMRIRIYLVHFYFQYCYMSLHPVYYPRTTLALPPSSNSDPGPHHRGPSSLFPTTVRIFIFYRQKNWAFSSLVDSRRIARIHAARRSQQLIFFSSFLHFCKYIQNLTTVGIPFKDQR